ncbi:MAG: acyl carrier protein [Candidatus Aminicenantes bacterium]|jgi:acyl carrier protein|nr:acyl carrier protein [Candidatus Aminicenantes bacterium]
MKRESIIERMSDILKKVMFNESLVVQPDDDLRAKLGMDSMGAVEFVSTVESEYKIKITEEELNNIGTLNEAADLVLQKLSEK